MKKIITILLTLCLVRSLVPAAFATEVTEETTAPTEVTVPVREPDQCGEDLRWKYEDGTLTVSGSGAMDDYSQTKAPWADRKEDVKKLVLSGVTYIGAEAFRDFDKLEEIEFGSHIREFGYRAFFGCDGLETLNLPMSFKIFGEESLRGCKNLKEIHCDGGFPSFRLNCLWESYVTIYFPADRPWPVSLIQELEEAFHGRIEFRASDGTDPYVPEGETEATEEPTVPTTEAPTEAPTTVPTEPPTEAPTEPPVETAAPTEEVTPETEPPAEPEVTEPEQTVPETQPEQELTGKERSALKIVVAVMAAAVVLTVAIALLMIFRRSGKRGKYEF